MFAAFFLLVILLLLDCMNRNAQRPTFNVEISKPVSHRMANGTDTCGARYWSDHPDHLFAFGDLAGAHSATKHGRTGAPRKKSARCVYRHRAFAATNHDQ